MSPFNHDDATWIELLPGLFRTADSCNVFVLKADDQAVAIDYGSGSWLEKLGEIGVSSVQHVLLTHVHRDQMHGLCALDEADFTLHVPGGDAQFLDGQHLKTFWTSYQRAGCPANYDAPTEPVDVPFRRIGEAGDLVWAGGRITAIPTPGHTKGALTYVTTWEGKQVAFCGDALTASGKIHQPYHLEWDHWTGEGARQAIHGLDRLGSVRIDLLCPSHGKVGKTNCVQKVELAKKKLAGFAVAKGSVCRGEQDRWYPVESVDDDTVRVSESLYLFSGNTYLLLDGAGLAMVVDPTLPSIERIRPLLQKLGVASVTATTATHYHRDHSDGLNWVRDNLGAPVWLHPRVADPLRDRDRSDLPWLPADSVRPDRVLPEFGTFKWGGYAFQIRPFPGQTCWHCAFDTHVDGQHVLFSGDNFQPPTRWNGTGGFCSYNGCRMADGFGQSARTVIDLSPDVICNGHGCVYWYDPGHYRKILKWARESEKAIHSVEASPGDFECRQQVWEPFRSSVECGQPVALKYRVTNRNEDATSYAIEPIVPDGWRVSPAARRMRVSSEGSRGVSFSVVPAENASRGRYVVTANVAAAGQPMGQPAAAIIDVV